MLNEAPHTVTTYGRLKTGAKFRFEEGGPLWVKSRAGFREVTGGQAHACQPHVLVIVPAKEECAPC